jgi:hypothetical protein
LIEKEEGNVSFAERPSPLYDFGEIPPSLVSDTLYIWNFLGVFRLGFHTFYLLFFKKK